ncbi:hypothetical protein Bca52824_020711 [Brassica carinata]|uniref:Uncharacterized protein n=1 Tax=Brassica carinata TaxID=52824 RepID=A0A8X8AYR5_BRACI|nr:hypothetical protein Bca52824_020711 [Brassica carinata]
MGTHINFNNLGGGGGGGEGSNQMKPADTAYPLARQSSLYSLTFDELQSTLGGPGKDFGSMNMDELLKSIWTAEEAQAMTMNSSAVAGAATAVAQPGGGIPLQRQGSLTLPRTISQKTVDEVWKCLFTKDGNNGNMVGSSGGGGGESNAPQRQQTLGEITLEEFLFRAGVVREDNCPQQVGQVNNGFYGNNGAPGGLGFGFGQPNQNNISFNNVTNDSMISKQPHQQFQQQSQPQLQPRQQLNQPHPQHQRLPQTIFPKQTNVAFTAPVGMGNKSFTGAGNNASNNNNNGLGSFGGGGVTVAATSPGTSSAENNSLSPFLMCLIEEEEAILV